MIEKLFPLDKNYILRQAQYALEEELMDQMVYELKRSYTYLYNPLQLMDQTYSKILDTFDFPAERVRMICGRSMYLDFVDVRHLFVIILSM